MTRRRAAAVAGVLPVLVVTLAFGAVAASPAPTPTPSPTPTVVVGPAVDVSAAVVLPVEDVAGAVEDLVFTRASADGAVTDQGGRTFVLASDVLFAFDKAALNARARTEIARIAETLTSTGPDAATDPDAAAGKVTTVTVTGYTDDVGSPGYNQGLSRRRAEAVRAQLARALGSGITVRAVGRGEADPVAPNTSKKGRQLNRRVEVRAG